MIRTIPARYARFFTAAVGAAGLVGAPPVTAGPVAKTTTPQKLELLTPKAKIGATSLLVRFVGKSGKPISGAVLTAASLDMAPMGMASMTAAVKPPKIVRPGVYRFDTTIQMSGRWAFTVVAKAPSIKRPIITSFMLAVTE